MTMYLDINRIEGTVKLIHRERVLVKYTDKEVEEGASPLGEWWVDFVHPDYPLIPYRLVLYLDEDTSVSRICGYIETNEVKPKKQKIGKLVHN